MSLLYEAIPHSEHEWLTTGKRAVIVTSTPHAGKVICVSISQKQADLNGDGIPDQLNVKIHSNMVNLETGEPILVGDTPIGTTANVNSLKLDGISQGSIDVTSWIAELIDGSVHKCLRHEAALKAFSLIPVGI
jgi:hypothetical protein